MSLTNEHTMGEAKKSSKECGDPTINFFEGEYQVDRVELPTEDLRSRVVELTLVEELSGAGEREEQKREKSP